MKWEEKLPCKMNVKIATGVSRACVYVKLGCIVNNDVFHLITSHGFLEVSRNYSCQMRLLYHGEMTIGQFYMMKKVIFDTFPFAAKLSLTLCSPLFVFAYYKSNLWN